MLPLMKSNAARVWLERDGEPVLYEVALSSPCSDLFLDHVDLHEQTKRDRLSLPVIRTRIRRWMRDEPDVKKVAVSYRASRYTVAILASPLTMTIMTCLQVGFENVLDIFGQADPLIWILGTEQRDAAMLYSPACSISTIH